jgi:nucleoside-diphosphate-sugar epimerase
MDREGTKSAFSSLGGVTDLVFAAYVEKPTMAETVEPNARMLKNTLGALAASNVPVQRVVLAGGAKSYGFSLGAFNAPAHVSLRRSTTNNKKTFWPTGPLRTGLAGRSCVPIWSWDQA